MRELDRLSSKLARRLDNAEAAQRKTRIRQDVDKAKTTAGTAKTTAEEALTKAEAAAPVQDDLVPPSDPVGTITVWQHNFRVDWDIKDQSEYVVYAEVFLSRVNADGTLTQLRIYKVQANTLWIPNLAVGTTYEVAVRLVDRWGRASATVVLGRAVPEPTVAEQIADDVQVAAERISGLIGNSQLATITDPAKLAGAVVKTLQAQANRNRLDLPESRFDAFPTGPWLGYGASAPGTVQSVVTRDGRNWLRHSCPAGAADTYVFPTWPPKDRGIDAGQWVIASATAKNASGVANTAAIGVNFYDRQNTPLGGLRGDFVAVPVGGEARVFVKAQAPAGTVRAAYFLRVQAGYAADFNDVMLEVVPSGQNAPSGYLTPVMFNGVIGAHLLATWDLTAVNAIIGDATIGQAKIRDLRVSTAMIENLAVTNAKIDSANISKLTTGTLVAAVMTLSANGYIKAGPRVTLDDMGIKMAPDTSEVAPSSQNVDYRIGSTGLWADMSFFDTGSSRGVRLRADGNTTNYPGRIRFIATPNGDPAHAAAVQMFLNGANGQVFTDGSVIASGSNGIAATGGDVSAPNGRHSPQGESAYASLAAGATATLPLAGSGSAFPRGMFVQVQAPNNAAVAYFVSHGGLGMTVFGSASGGSIYNGSGAAQTVRLTLYR
jgi:hypothetical protein